MSMPQLAQHWTREMVLALPNDGFRHELIDGEHIVSPAPSLRHEEVLMSLTRRIDPYVTSSGIAKIMNVAADLALGEDEVLQPDLFVYPKTSPRPQEWLDITSLLLVVEILSPSTARHDRGRKRRRYQRARVPEYWVVDPDARVVERWRPDDERPEVLDATLKWTPGVHVPSLIIDLPTLFEEALGDD